MNPPVPVIESAPVAASQSPEAAFAARVPMERRKRLGQFFTPPAVAQAMTDWCCRHAPEALLDPAVGPGIFPACALALPPSRRPKRIVGYDVDRDALAVADARLMGGAACDVTLHHGDFLLQPAHSLFASDDRFDAILCNPPYIRHHEASVSQDAYDALEAAWGVRLSRMTNVYALFLLRIASMLTAQGRAAIITPAEFLNADFGVAVKTALLKSGLLRGFIIFDHATSVFDGILTTAAITLLDARVSDSQRVELQHVETADELNEALRAIDGDVSDAGACGARASVDRKNLDPQRKWATTSRTDEASQASSLPMRPMSDYATCSRGIATGANDFFSLTRGEARQWNLPEAALRPCVTKAPQVRGSRWTDARMQALINAGKKALLLDAVALADHDAVKRYVAHGESQALHLRYLTRHRKPWFAIERRPAADIWVATFGRGRLRFVWNQSAALHLTAFHGLYLRPEHRPWVRHLLAYLHSEIGWTECRGHHRVYGDGLLKFEPRDVERLRVPDFGGLPASRLTAIAEAADAVLNLDGATIPRDLCDRLSALFA